MNDKKKLVEDVMSLGNAIVGNVLGARHEFKAQAKQKLDFLTQQLDLVSRAEFDAAFAMLSKARLMQEDLNERLQKIESHLGLSSAKKNSKTNDNVKKATKVNLPSVKHARGKTKRK